MNSIERLRDVTERTCDCGDEMCSHCGDIAEQHEAVAAVEALHQAAAPLGDYDLNAAVWVAQEHPELRVIRTADLESLMRRLDALAAAVRRVDGEA